MSKHEWRKSEKAVYIPKAVPELINVPRFNFISLSGEGSPATEGFSDVVGALYAIAYTIKMHLKKMDSKPKSYFDFTVYPLEGVWDINDEAKGRFNGVIDKNDLVYDMMIRQPDFVSDSLFLEMLDLASLKKPNELFNKVKFSSFSEGACIQMLHLGRFEEEQKSFDLMERYADTQGATRKSKVHREIYLSDARKVEPEKLKTVLRFQVCGS